MDAPTRTETSKSGAGASKSGAGAGKSGTPTGQNRAGAGSTRVGGNGRGAGPVPTRAGASRPRAGGGGCPVRPGSRAEPFGQKAADSQKSSYIRASAGNRFRGFSPFYTLLVMKKEDYYPQTIATLLAWLRLQLTQWAAKFGLFGYTDKEAADIANHIQGALDANAAVVKAQSELDEATTRRDNTLSTFETYYRALVQRARRVEGLDVGIPEAFKWNGVAQAPPDPDTTKPRVPHTHVLPNEITLDFIRAGFDGVDVDYSYDGQTWTRGEFDMRSPYHDLRPNQVPGQPETRYYRFRYRYKGKPFGQYTQVQATSSGN